ncbi:transcriptional regulator AraC family protein [Marinomonas sp. MED121]|uniref:helix-turn-helix domain-containing protein n=1 Tax=Marinomonas sp. MED121 TaxID=314277 RepID=UPI00006911C2|nr:AraC family transcriptional regulator [Marinomonas sp. MED121]EAQ67750.1 transcriptional regulator AraC family protein [Marinomonas sp. MED121]
MDRLTSLLNHFRPQVKSVNYVRQHRDNSEQASDASLIQDAQTNASLSLSADSSYLLYIAQGTLSFVEQDFMLGAPEETFTQGSILWLAAGCELKLDPLAQEQDAAILVCEYDFGLASLNPLLDTQSKLVGVGQEDDIALAIAPIMAVLMQELDKLSCGFQVVSERLAEALLVQFLRLLMQQKRLPFGLLAALSDDKLARAIVAIHDQPAQAWTVERLAQQAGMSRTAFNNAFRDKLGHTPLEYVTLWRMRLANQKLRQGQHNLAALSLELGYQSETAFRRAFKKNLGFAPGQVRKRQQAEIRQQKSVRQSA